MPNQNHRLNLSDLLSEPSDNSSDFCPLSSEHWHPIPWTLSCLKSQTELIYHKTFVTFLWDTTLVPNYFLIGRKRQEATGDAAAGLDQIGYDFRHRSLKTDVGHKYLSDKVGCDHRKASYQK